MVFKQKIPKIHVEWETQYVDIIQKKVCSYGIPRIAVIAQEQTNMIGLIITNM